MVDYGESWGQKSRQRSFGANIGPREAEYFWQVFWNKQTKNKGSAYLEGAIKAQEDALLIVNQEKGFAS